MLHFGASALDQRCIAPRPTALHNLRLWHSNDDVSLAHLSTSSTISMAGNWSALLYLDPPSQSRSPSPAVASATKASKVNQTGRQPSTTNVQVSPLPADGRRDHLLRASRQNLPQTPPCAPERAPIIKPQPVYKPQTHSYKVGGTMTIMQNYIRKADAPITLPNGQSVYPRYYELPPSLLKSINHSYVYGLAKGAKYPLLDKAGKPMHEGQVLPKYAEVWREGRNIVVRASPRNEEEDARLLDKREKRARRWGF